MFLYVYVYLLQYVSVTVYICMYDCNSMYNCVVEKIRTYVGITVLLEKKTIIGCYDNFIFYIPRAGRLPYVYIIITLIHRTKIKDYAVCEQRSRIYQLLRLRRDKIRDEVRRSSCNPSGILSSRPRSSPQFPKRDIRITSGNW